MLHEAQVYPATKCKQRQIPEWIKSWQATVFFCDSHDKAKGNVLCWSSKARIHLRTSESIVVFISLSSQTDLQSSANKGYLLGHWYIKRPIQRMEPNAIKNQLSTNDAAIKILETSAKVSYTFSISRP